MPVDWSGWTHGLRPAILRPRGPGAGEMARSRPPARRGPAKLGCAQPIFSRGPSVSEFAANEGEVSAGALDYAALNDLCDAVFQIARLRQGVGAVKRTGAVLRPGIKSGSAKERRGNANQKYPVNPSHDKSSVGRFSTGLAHGGTCLKSKGHRAAHGALWVVQWYEPAHRHRARQ